MTDQELAELREAAVEAVLPGEPWLYAYLMERTNVPSSMCKFIDKANPKTILALLDEIDELKRQPKWIACSERMPEPDQRVLVSYMARDGEIVTEAIYTPDYAVTHRWQYWYGVLSLSNVDHWMPLPEPTK